MEADSSLVTVSITMLLAGCSDLNQTVSDCFLGLQHKEKDLFGISLARVNVFLLRYATSAADLHLLTGAVLRASVLCNLEFGYTSILGHYVQKYRNNLSKIIVRLSALSFTTTTTSKA